MVTSIHNTWGEFHTACAQLLALAHQEVCIFAAELGPLGLEQSDNAEALRRLVTHNPAASVRIALKRTDTLSRDNPRLIQLLQSHSHIVHVQQTPDSLQQLRDTLLIIDGTHTLVRFEQDHPRCKLILADNIETKPYTKRFEEIWQEGGHPFSARPLGL